MSKIALVDCDSFYASCEQLMNPALKNKPVVVMSNNDGCIVARSKEAKELGIKMGMPVFQAKKIFPDVHYISGNLGMYGDISNRVMAVLSEYTPIVEIYSIDEAFIDLTGLKGLYRKSYFEIAFDIKREIFNRVGIPVSIGISTTKVLAKLATERAKKQEGVYRIGFRDISNELKNTDVIEVWGVGGNTAALLNKFRVYTAYQLTLQDDSWISKILGKKGLELKQELLGKSVYPVHEEETLPKSIQKTSSFAKFTSDRDYIKNSLYYHTHRACRKLRKLKMKTSVISVMLRTKDFKVSYDNISLMYPTDSEFEIYQAVDKIFVRIFTSDIIYRSSGITFHNLCLESETQLSLFNSVNESLKNDKFNRLWDKLENKYGRKVITTGVFKSV